MNERYISLTVKEIRTETDEYLSVIFVRPDNFSFTAGECMDLRFPDVEFSVFKTFSFASSPTEKELMISFKKGKSEYKKRLENLKKGDMMEMRMYGNMFNFEPEFKSVFFAGGIGIAPFRSMIKFAIDTEGESKEITLIYLNHNNEFPFRNEFKNWQQELEQINIHYISTEKEGRLTKEKIEELVTFDDETISYIAGPPNMVDATMEILNTLGVNDDKIKTDSFDGYVEQEI